MKKLLLTLAAVAVSVSVYAQGTVVFSNIGAPGGGVQNLATGALVAGTDGLLAALYYDGASGWETIGTAVTFLGNGLFTGGTRTADVTPPGSEGTFQVKIWEQAFGATYEDAIAAPAQDINGTVRLAIAGESSVFTSDTGDPTTVPPGTAVNLAPNLGGLTVDVIVPEPSVIALGVLGAGALLLLRRRK